MTSAVDTNHSLLAPMSAGLAAADSGARPYQEAATANRVAQVMERRRKAEAQVRQARVMLIDDEESNLTSYRRILEGAGYTNLSQTTNSASAVGLIALEKPDLLVLDLAMPDVTGVDILAALACNEQFEQLPVLVLTSPQDGAMKQTALNLGATDFLLKPVDRHELLARVRNALAIRNYQDRLQRYASDLEHTIRSRTKDLTASRQEVVLCLARAAEYRDDVTGRHVMRVGKYVGVLARKLGFTPRDVELLELAAQLHDIGKIGIPDAILKKPGKLTPDEYAQMKQHCAMGLHILRPITDEIGGGPVSRPSPLLSLAGRIAATHHERWDGTGYPFGLKGEDIPIEGRLTAVADVFDSLTSAILQNGVPVGSLLPNSA